MSRTARAAPWAGANETLDQALARLAGEAAKHETHEATAAAFGVDRRTVLRWWAWCAQRGHGGRLPPRPRQTAERRARATQTRRRAVPAQSDTNVIPTNRQ